MARKVEQPDLSSAEVEILKERIGNMTPEEQKIVAECIDSSIMHDELKRRDSEKSIAIHEAAEDLRRVQRAWLK